MFVVSVFYHILTALPDAQCTKTGKQRNPAVPRHVHWAWFHTCSLGCLLV